MSYVWNFGDGDTSHQIGSVVHTYANPGTYTVTLTVRDSCGGVSTTSEEIDVNASGIATVSGLSSVNVYPNPSNGNFNIDLNIQATETVTISLINQLGQTLQTHNNEVHAGHNILGISGSELATGIYYLQLSADNETVIKKITISR